MYFIKRDALDHLKAAAVRTIREAAVDPSGLKVLPTINDGAVEKAVLQALASMTDDPHAMVGAADIAHLAKVDDDYVFWPPMRTMSKPE